MCNDSPFALPDPAALVASHDKVARVCEIVILILELPAEVFSALENVITFTAIPSRDVKGVIHLVFGKDFSNSVIVDIRPHKHAA